MNIKPTLILLHPESNLSIENILRIDIFFASNNMHRTCVRAFAILRGTNV